MKKKILSLFLLASVALGSFAGCDLSSLTGGSKDSSPSSDAKIEAIDYAGLAVLDESADSQTTEVESVKMYIDGDTTHFYVEDGIIEHDFLKARYAAVNTPESTGQIEEWGKKASNFTKEKLKNATSIVLETDGSTWEVDSTGERYLVWVWYKAEGADTYRNLNLELLQEGLAVGSTISECRYAQYAAEALNQASLLKLNVHSNDPDPDFFYGSAIEIDLRELRTNLDEYNGKKVAFEGYVSYYSSNGVFVESYDAETDFVYGIYVYVGYDYVSDANLKNILSVGNHVRIVGKCSNQEGFGYQISDIKYRAVKPNDPDNVQKLDDEKYSAQNRETDATVFNGTKIIELEDEKKAFKYAKLALDSSISFKNLKVVDMYTTTKEDSDNKGAITITCKVDGQTITVRTAVLKDANGNLVTEAMFEGKTIDVQGVVEEYEGQYQIKVFSLKDINIH